MYLRQASAPEGRRVGNFVSILHILPLMDGIGIATADQELSQVQKASIGTALVSVLGSEHFCKSRRYPILLEHLVRHTLTGETDLLKERTIGVAVFARPVDWDTGNDSIVRQGAVQVRKRLALYYSEHPGAEVRIGLPVGGYVPVFSFAPPVQQPDTLPLQKVLQPARQPASFLAKIGFHAPIQRAHYSSLVFACALAAVAAISLLAWRHQKWRDAPDFWAPVLDGPQPAVIIVGGSPGIPPTNGNSPQSTPTRGIPWSATGPQTSADESALQNRNPLRIGETLPMAHICGVFRSHRRDCPFVLADTTSVASLQGKSLVLIGSFNNSLTMPLMAGLPYQFQSDDPTPPPGNFGVRSNHHVILDQFHLHSSSPWKISQETAHPPDDYLIVARFHSDLTGSMVVIASGISPQGTTCAGEVLSSPEAMQNIAQLAPKKWAGTSFEAVLHTYSTPEKPAKPEVVASYFW